MSRAHAYLIVEHKRYLIPLKSDRDRVENEPCLRHWLVSEQTADRSRAGPFGYQIGTRLTYCNVHLGFKRIVEHAGLTPRSTVRRPRPHDLRHTFAVNTLLDASPSAEVATLDSFQRRNVVGA